MWRGTRVEAALTAGQFVHERVDTKTKGHENDPTGRPAGTGTGTMAEMGESQSGVIERLFLRESLSGPYKRQ